MARKKRRKKVRKPIFENLEKETRNGIWSVIFFVLAAFFSVSKIGKAGMVGDWITNAFTHLLGVGYYLVPLVLLLIAIAFIKPLTRELKRIRLIGSGLFFISGLTLIGVFNTEQGGVVGGALATWLQQLFDFWGSVIMLSALLVISTIIIFEAKISLDQLFFWRKDGEPEYENEEEDLNEDEEEEEEVTEYEEKPARELKLTGILHRKKQKTPDALALLPSTAPSMKEYVPPPLSLLGKDKGKPGVGDIKANANLIKRTLENFGISVVMDEISIGPTVTRYALKPAEGVRLSKIVSLQNNLELALAAHPVRIEAPIPGKSLVGIEVPNTVKSTVGLAGLLSAKDYQGSTKPLLVSLGKGISGKSYFANLAKMPHVLIAGATGSGKSVTIHTLINSLLFRNSPDQLKFIMIDPKRVELTLYNGIPHLLTPVITNAKKAILALKWATKEMDRRYDILEQHSVRDIQSYHQNIFTPALEKYKAGNEDIELPYKMPYMAVIIDELADIMQAYPRELESSIVRLAQMSRAVGIHLILSTQRPSVNVITGLIKANVPARIALQVASQIDSRTILDTVGAEKLLGAGDMLYLSGEMSKPERIQSAFMSEQEVKSIVKYLKKEYEGETPDEIDIAIDTADTSDALFGVNLDNDGLDADEDDLYEDARETVIRAGKASTSYIQRKLRVGYARAARLMDMLEERGVIGPAQGSKPREIILESENNDLHDQTE